MLRYYFLYWLLLPLVYLRSFLSLPPEGGGLLQHFLFPFVHAGFLHWALNGWCLLCLSPYISKKRTFFGYAFSVLCGYLWHESLPLCGISTIIYFYLGLLFIHMSRFRRIRLLVLALFGLLLPNIAAVTHLIMLLFGILSEFFRLNYTRHERF